MSEAGDSRSAAAGEMTDTTPGARLARAREAQNLTAADVARRLKLSVWQIEALEAGRYDRLPAPIFVRGYIRSYALLLKLDPANLLHAAADTLPQAAPRPEAPPFQDIPFPSSTVWRWWKYAIGAAMVVAVLAAYEFYWNEPENEAQLPVTEAETPVTQIASPPAPPSPQPTASAPGPRPAVTTPTSIPTPPAAPAARDSSSIAGAGQISGKPAAPGERELRFVFDEEAWVEIRDRSDRTIYSQLNRAGTAQRVTGVPPLTIVVGNAHGVKLTYAGRPVDLARHTKIDVARLTLE